MTSQTHGPPLQVPDLASSSHAGSSNGAEGPSPAHAFRHQLDQLVVSAYCLVRDTMKKQVAPLLPLCVCAPPPGSAASPTPAGPRRPSAFGREAEAARFAPSDPAARFTLSEEETVSELPDGAPSPSTTALTAALQRQRSTSARTSYAGGIGNNRRLHLCFVRAGWLAVWMVVAEPIGRRPQSPA